MSERIRLVDPATGLDYRAGNTVDASGNPLGSSANPTYERAQGSPTVSTSQPATSVSPATSLLVVAARSGRRSVTITNITGTQPVYLKGTASIDGTTTGFYLAAVAGASITIPYSGALYGTSPTAAQTLAVMEVY